MRCLSSWLRTAIECETLLQFDISSLKLLRNGLKPNPATRRSISSLDEMFFALRQFHRWNDLHTGRRCRLSRIWCGRNGDVEHYQGWNVDEIFWQSFAFERQANRGSVSTLPRKIIAKRINRFNPNSTSFGSLKCRWSDLESLGHVGAPITRSFTVFYPIFPPQDSSRLPINLLQMGS